MPNRVRLGILFALVFSALWLTLPTHGDTSPSPVNDRTFYFGPSATLTSSRPTGSTPFPSNLTQRPSFVLPNALLSPLTLGSKLTFSLWTKWAGTNLTLIPVIGATFDYKYPGSAVWTNLTSFAAQSMTPGWNNLTIVGNISPPSLPDLTSIGVQIFVDPRTVPQHTNVTLYWGSSREKSSVAFQLSGYETLVQTNPVAILDRTDTPTTYFPVNAGPGNNIVLVKTLVTSALGFGDIRSVNMTIIDPSGKAVRDAANLTMQPPNDRANPPFQFGALWVYHSNSSTGTYQIWVVISDIQNHTAYSYRGAASFALVPPNFVPFPYNLIPYFLIGGVVAAVGGGAYYYRQRTRKSYLVPFDYFNSLAGGGLNDGTIVAIEGNTGSGKTLLSEQLMYQDLRNGKPCVFVSTIDFPSNIRSNMKTMGLDVSGYEQNGLLTFVDAYSAEAGQESKEKVSVPSLGDLTTLGMKISSTLPSASFKGGSLYFDSLSPLTSKAKPESIVSFAQTVGARLKGLSGKAFFTMGPGIDGSVQRQLEENADCIVQMEAFEETGSRKRRLRIAKLRARTHLEGWTEFTIEEGKGIIFYSSKKKK
ncbi:MAG TPA: RAD55 family ATPase [Candidatus Bathyarchaeia archaeon]|nr:RAD55 family ATPase [Candidatus Bathyarchaeia archaeon]